MLDAGVGLSEGSEGSGIAAIFVTHGARPRPRPYPTRPVPPSARMSENEDTVVRSAGHIDHMNALPMLLRHGKAHSGTGKEEQVQVYAPSTVLGSRFFINKHPPGRAPSAGTH